MNSAAFRGGAIEICLSRSIDVRIEVTSATEVGALEPVSLEFEGRATLEVFPVASSFDGVRAVAMEVVIKDYRIGLASDLRLEGFR